MTAFAVKQYGSRRGCKGTTKAAIIEELFDDAPPALAAEIAVPETPKSEIKNDHELFEFEMVTLIGNFYSHYKPGFDADMAHLALKQARLWMLKTLAG
jgi:hypothetical protein